MRKLLYSTLIACVAAASPLAQGQPAPQQIAFDYTVIYEAMNPSIVKIHADAATGSGFLVSDSGLIATKALS